MDFLSKSWWFDVAGNFDISEYNFTRVPVAVTGMNNYIKDALRDLL
jgi:hypothetical protein